MALPPTKLSDFQLASTIGAGATARVYDAVHVATGASVAIKILHPDEEAHGHGPGAAAEIRERFAREALILAELDSRHVGKITGFGFEQGRPFLVLEKLRGETLDAKLRRDGPIPLPTALRWIEQLLVGVRDCHDAKIIHRDIKPSNVFIHDDRFEAIVKLIDFGVARLREITNPGRAGAGGLTGKNTLLGSMGYMAPEQFDDPQHVSFPADLYAVGVVVYRALTGRLPFVSRSVDQIIKMKLERKAPAVSSMPNMPKSVLLDWFVAKAMERDARARFANAREMLEAWWNVMASFDEDGATDVMRGVGRVDESYAGPVPRTPLAPESHDDQTIEGVRPSILEAMRSTSTLNDAAPNTLPSPVGVSPLREAQPIDPYTDMPTRNDPSLRKLVEQELAIQRKKKSL